MVSSGCRNVKGTSTKSTSVVKACGFAFFCAALAFAVTVTAAAVIVTTLLADNGAFFVSDVANVVLGVEVVFTDVALDVVDVALDAALGAALVADAGGTAAAGADEPQKSAPVPHLPFVEH